MYRSCTNALRWLLYSMYCTINTKRFVPRRGGDRKPRRRVVTKLAGGAIDAHSFATVVVLLDILVPYSTYNRQWPNTPFGDT